MYQTVCVSSTCNIYLTSAFGNTADANIIYGAISDVLSCSTETVLFLRLQNSIRLLLGILCHTNCLPFGLKYTGFRNRKQSKVLIKFF